MCSVWSTFADIARDINHSNNSNTHDESFDDNRKKRIMKATTIAKELAYVWTFYERNKREKWYDEQETLFSHTRAHTHKKGIESISLSLQCVILLICETGIVRAIG